MVLFLIILKKWIFEYVYLYSYWRIWKFCPGRKVVYGKWQESISSVVIPVYNDNCHSKSCPVPLFIQMFLFSYWFCFCIDTAIGALLFYSVTAILNLHWTEKLICLIVCLSVYGRTKKFLFHSENECVWKCWPLVKLQLLHYFCPFRLHGVSLTLFSNSFNIKDNIYNCLP